MLSKRRVIALAAGMFFIASHLAAPRAYSQGNGNGHGQGNGNGHGKGHEKHGHDDDDRYDHYYRDHDQNMWKWYGEHENHLPPGLAKKDRLPPGLEKQLVRNGHLPPGLEKKLEPCPRELVRYLPPPPSDCVQVLVGGHVVLLNQRTNIVVDLFHFEIR
jgi:hypothetical protein